VASPGFSPKALCTNSAGNIVGFTDINVSNDGLGGAAPGSSLPFSARPDTIFLCRGDEFTIDFNEGSEDLSGDPVPETQAGIGWAIYECLPTVTGTSVAEVNADPCNPDEGLPPFASGDFLISTPTDYFGGDYSLRVENILPPFNTEFYPGPDGEPGPVVLTLAPITADSLDLTFPNAPVFQSESVEDSLGNEITPECINVATDQYVTVGFLNPIEVRDPQQNDCSGSFIIRGGVAELRGTTDYIITLTNTATNQEVNVDDLSIYRSGDVVSYTVPSPGDYRINVQDEISCEFDGLVVTHDACPVVADIEITATPTDVTCPGDTDGTVTVLATGGTAPYTVRLVRTTPASPPFSRELTAGADGEAVVFEDLSSGVYAVTVFDAFGNSEAQPGIEIIEPNESVGIQVVQGFECFDDVEGGSLEAIIFDGANPTDPSDYTFAWSNGATTRIIDNLTPGNYTVTATNSTTGCVSTESINLRAPSRLIVENSDGTSDPATCNGVPDGSVDIPISGGTQDTNGEYTVTYSDGFSEQATRVQRSDLEPGNYSVVITDINGCEAQSQFTVQALKTLLINADSTNVSCFGEADGTITVTPDFDGVAPDYPLTIEVLNEDGTSARAPQDFDEGGDPVEFDGFGPGQYIIVLQDQDPEGCETRDTVTITEPELLEIADVVTTDVGCPDITGTATVEVTGGTLPYTYRFVNDSIPNPADTTMTFDTTLVDPDLNVLEELQPDTNYYVIVTDANGCVADTFDFDIFSPPQAIIEPIATAFVSCPGDTDGQLTVVARPPSDTLEIESYTWYRLNPDNTLGEEVASGRTTSANLTVGFYVVEILLSNECTSQALGEVASPGLVQLDSFLLIDPICLGESNGSIFIFPSGGTPDEFGEYNITWTSPTGNDIPPPTDPTNLNGLAAGTYSVTITDVNGCQPAFDTSFVLTDPVGIVGEFTIEDVSCPDPFTDDGSATFAAELSDGSGGTFDFRFFGNTRDTSFTNVATATATGLTRGPITVEVTDGTCARIFEDTIGSPPDFDFTLEVEDASCAGDMDGVAEVVVTGGTPEYSYELVGRGEVDPRIDELSAGFYELVVTDDRGCSPDTIPIFIREPNPLVLAIDPLLSTPLVTCFGDSNGVVAVEVISSDNNDLGDDPFTWSANVEDNDDAVARNLGPGAYTVSVTDVEGCSDTVSYTIGEPTPISFTVADPVPPLCFGETTNLSISSATGGQAAGFDSYTFSLNNDGFLIPVDQPGTTFAGEVVVTVFDSVGCFAEDTVIVTQPEEILIDIPDRIIIELGDSLTQLNPIVTPATGNYRYRYTPPDFLSNDSIRNPTIFPLQSRNYTLLVTNENGCEAITDFLVDVDANRNVYIPNAISPNQDGRNEELRIYACQGVVRIDLVNIYNRWGGLVSTIDDLPPNCLDGTIVWNGFSANGSEVEAGVYVYTMQVTFLDGVTLTYRGDVAVVR
jgi:hypothetical protein